MKKIDKTVAAHSRSRLSRAIFFALLASSTLPALTHAQAAPATANASWMNKALSANERARLLESAMTQEERFSLLHGPMALSFGSFKPPAEAIPAAGYYPAIPRLGIPALTESDASLGVTNPMGARPGDVATALPSGLSLAATWNPALAQAAGAAIGQEAHAKGFNILLAGGANLTRDPRGGRNFEYLSEDPLLTGVMAGESIKGIQSQHIVSTIKHFALNSYENGRNVHNISIGEAAARESDLLAFQIAIEIGQPGSVMCAYNKVNGHDACSNNTLLNKVLKGDWGYPGWVMSDWGAVSSMQAAVNGLDQQSGEQLDKQVWFNEPLKKALASGEVTQAQVSDKAQRILRSLFATGAFDDPAKQGGAIDYAAHGKVARQAAAEGMVLLRNEKNTLPLSREIKRIAIIGGNASFGVLSGGGSSQVTPPGDAIQIQPLGGSDMMDQLFRRAVWFPSSPLAAIRSRLPKADISFNDGRYPSSAAELAKQADVVIVFATQWSGENEDLPDISLPQGQDALIAAVTAANPHTVVVLETSNPIAMPWLDKTAAVLEAWFPGQHGGEAIADVLFGDVNPSGHLPITFPKSTAQLPRPIMPGTGVTKNVAFDIPLTEGADVGYRWFAKTKQAPLFAFGHGLSYTSFASTNLKVSGDSTLTISFDVKNTGQRAGAHVPQVYLTSAAGKPVRRLIGWDKVELAAGEQKHLTLRADPRLLGFFDQASHSWKISAGEYKVVVGDSASQPRLTGKAQLKAQSLKP